MDVIKPIKKLISKLEEDDVWLDVESKNRHSKKELLSYLLVESLKSYIPSTESKFSDFHSKSYENQLNEVIKTKIDCDVGFVSSKGNYINTSSENTDTHQRVKQEMTIKNMCCLIGIEIVEIATCSRGNKYYRPKGVGNFQSASNTILELSFRLASRKVNATN